MNCPSCPTPIPVVSERAGAAIASRLLLVERAIIKLRSFEWLTDKHLGLHLYLGIHGRAYTADEKVAIALETKNVSELVCPYHAERECILRDYTGHLMFIEEGPTDRFGWLPTLLARALDPDLLRDLAHSQAIADAKIAILTRKTGFPDLRQDTRIHSGR